MGEFSFVNILDAPDNETMVRISIMLGLRGTVRMETYPAYEMGTVFGGVPPAKSR
jgi:uncharacterized protein with GYD domain